MASEHRKAARIASCILFVVAGLGLATAGSAGADDQTGPQVAIVTPGPWQDRQRVVVQAEGLDPSTPYALVDCAGGECTPSWAYLSPGPGTNLHIKAPPAQYQRGVRSDVDGRFTRGIDLSRSVWLGSGSGTVDCSTQACELGLVPLTSGDDGPPVARIPLAFVAGTYVWPDGTLTVTGDPVVHEGSTRVQATGLDPFRLTTRYQLLTAQWETGATPLLCAAGPDAPDTPRCREVSHLFQPNLLWPQVESDGSVDTTIALPRFVHGGAEAWDCAVDPCSLQLTQPKVSTNAAPVVFAEPWAPHESPAAFLDAAAATLRAGMPAADRDAAAARLASGEITVLDAVRSVAAFDHVTGDVATLYTALLHRRPETAGLQYWEERLTTGTSPGRVADSFSNTPETRAGHQHLDDAGAIEWTYQSTLGGSSDAAGRAYWLERLASGLPRYRMISMFALTPESRARTAPQRELASLTEGLQQRGPTADEWRSLTAGPSSDTPARLWWLLDRGPLLRSA